MNLKKVKNAIIGIIGFSNYRKILTTVMRSVTKVKDKIMFGEYIEDVKEYTVPGKDTFFGYYDIPSLSEDATKLLSIVIDGSIAEIGYFDVSSKVFHKISETHAWNWQMGARLRWYESGKSVLFNDFDGTNFISRVVDINGKELIRFPYPIFDVDLNSKLAYFCDFTILHHLREGYGYSNKAIDFDSYYKTTRNGLFVFRLGDDNARLVLSVDDLMKLQSSENMKGAYHYINHITINRTNGDVMFFHLWTNGDGTWMNRMVFVNNEGNIINIISDFDRALHYSWKDQNHILVSVYIGDKTEYRLYNYRNGTYDLVNGIKTDGHPSFLDARFFVTDTYANRCAMESIYICDIKEHAYRNIFSIYHDTNKVGPLRCDLHPRIKGNYINFDAIPNGHRSQYLLTVKYDKRGTTQWDRLLLLDKQAYISKPCYQSSSLFACIDSEYCFLTGRPVSNKIKAISMFLNNSTFRANVYINRLQKTAGKKHAKLQARIFKKYGIVIDASSIGKHFRADHVVGIVIGSGAVIGDYCRIYQNVTIGQKNGRFPTIGDHVTIFPGAVIVGDVKIGDYAVIGANSVVTKDVPEGAIAVGAPARNITGENK